MCITDVPVDKKKIVINEIHSTLNVRFKHVYILLLLLGIITVSLCVYNSSNHITYSCIFVCSLSYIHTSQSLAVRRYNQKNLKPKKWIPKNYIPFNIGNFTVCVHIMYNNYVAYNETQKQVKNDNLLLTIIEKKFASSLIFESVC